MYRISKEFAFSASHQLLNLPEGHKCAGLHGHNYIVVLDLASPTVDEAGFVIDVHELKDLKTYIDDVFDHAHLNDVMDVSPSTENVAKHFTTGARHGGIRPSPCGCPKLQRSGPSTARELAYCRGFWANYSR